MAGSLFYSEFAHFAPCELCWIQRGLLYTQAVILFLALFARKEEHVRRFQNLTQKACLALSAIGFPIAAYHMYLQFGGGALVPCSAIGPTCSICLLPYLRLHHHPYDVAYRVRVDTVLYAFAPAGGGEIKREYPTLKFPTRGKPYNRLQSSKADDNGIFRPSHALNGVEAEFR